MKELTFGARGAVILGGLAAGVLDLAAVLAFWAARDVPPVVILQSIASARLGDGAFEGGAAAALIGLVLHFGVSFVFAAAWVAAALHASALRSRPVASGLGYGVIAYVIMTFVVVPLSRAEFGGWPPPPVNLAASVFIHLFLFGLPIALLASRMRPDRPVPRGGRLTPLAGILAGGLVAGALDILAAFAAWAPRDVGPETILQSVASGVLGRAAYEGGPAAAALGAGLHFAASFVFAAGYVLVSLRAVPMRAHPVVYGLLYGLIVHWIMSEVVVPLSRAAIGSDAPAPGFYALTLLIHMLLFGLPIALAASRIRSPAGGDRVPAARPPP